MVNNPSPYVVRLLTEIELLPSAQKLSMPHTYVLPGQTVRLQIPKGISAQSVKIQPANLYGFAADDFTAPIK